jgi:hypothetical protein
MRNAVRLPVRPLTREEAASKGDTDTDSSGNNDGSDTKMETKTRDGDDDEALATPQEYISYEVDGELIVRRQRYFSVKRGVLYWGERKTTSPTPPTTDASTTTSTNDTTNASTSTPPPPSSSSATAATTSGDDMKLRLLGSMALKDITDVFVGKQSPVFSAPAAADARPQQCFALVGRTATLYIQMNSEVRYTFKLF